MSQSQPVMMDGNRPNILVIMTDEHRWDCVGTYGNNEVLTPHIDMLAQDGVRFENCFTCAPLCTPARYSFLTGLYPHQHLGWNNRSTMMPGLATFPKILKTHGYETTAVGKMHFNPPYLDVGIDSMHLAEQDGDGRYVDSYHRGLKSLGLLDAVDLMDQVSEFRAVAPDKYWETMGALQSNLPEYAHSTSWIGKRAVEELEKWTDFRSHLLFVSFIKPHHPFDPAPPWSSMYDPKSLNLLPGWTDECLTRDIDFDKGYFPHLELEVQKMQQILAYYYADISHIDDYVGEMLEVLHRKQLYDNTLVIFTSDHGDYMGFHHLLLKSNYMYDPVIRVPLIIKFPQSFQMGTQNLEMVSSIDVCPTILASVGLNDSSHFPGMDLLKIARGESRRTHILAESEQGHQVVIRTTDYKWIRTLHGELMFDLRNDPYEYTDISASDDYQEIKSDLKLSLLETLLSCPPQVYKGEIHTEIDCEERTLGAAEEPVMRDWSRKMFANWLNLQREL